MDPFVVADRIGDTLLQLTPVGDRLHMTVMDPVGIDHSSVGLHHDWFRPLAAWFAGEAEPIVIRERPLRRLAIIDDEAAMIWGANAWARLRCHQPYGIAWVTVGPRRDPRVSITTTLSPEARTNLATWLRRVDAEDWLLPRAAA